MKDSGYFRLLGGIVFLGGVGIIIWWSFITFSGQYTKMNIALFEAIIIFIALLIFAPSLGLLLLSHARVLDELEKRNKEE